VLVLCYSLWPFVSWSSIKLLYVPCSARQQLDHLPRILKIIYEEVCWSLLTLWQFCIIIHQMQVWYQTCVRLLWTSNYTNKVSIALNNTKQIPKCHDLSGKNDVSLCKGSLSDERLIAYRPSLVQNHRAMAARNTPMVPMECGNSLLNHGFV